MNFRNIIAEIDNSIGMIIINRPKVRNALDQNTVEEISELLDIYEEQDEVQVIVITGSGEKSFAAGADIAALKNKTMLEALLPGLQGLCTNIENCSKPTIAAINGFALGGGCEVAMSCDIRVASEHSKIGLPELNLAIIPGAGGTQRLSRLVGKGKAIELILTGQILNAEEAKEIGLVNKVTTYGELSNEVKKYANKITEKGPLAVQLAKLSIHSGSETDIRTGMIIEKLAQAILFTTEDQKEGATAFLEKRKANFKRK